MSREAMLAQDALSPQFIKYNPCYYCKRTTTCRWDCVPKTGFMMILSDSLTNFYKTTTEETVAKLALNAEKYNLPIKKG